jgi:hypothetical protein
MHVSIPHTSCYLGCMAEDRQRLEMRLSIATLVLGVVQGDTSEHSLFVDE